MVDATYRCPHCGVVAHVERETEGTEESVTPYPLDGWTYAGASEGFESDVADGVRFVCGSGEEIRWDDAGCGTSFYLNFPRYTDGEPVEQRPTPEYVEHADGPKGPWEPRGPDRF